MTVMPARRRVPIGCWLLLLVGPIVAGQGMAQDFLGVANAYGQWRVQTLQTAIMSTGLRPSVGGASTGQDRPSWPAIDEASLDHAVLTLADLRAMRSSDAQRMSGLLVGRRVSVAGVVGDGNRPGRVMYFEDPDVRYSVQGRWLGGAPPLAAGTPVVVTGEVAEVRAAWIVMHEPEVRVDDGARHRAAAAGEGERNVPAQASSAGSASLEFEASEQVSREVSRLLAERLGELDPAIDAVALAREFDSGSLQRDFRQLVGEHGFSDSNLADVMTIFLGVGWQIVHDQPDLDEPRGYRRMRDALGEAMLQSQWLALLSDADKQSMAEPLVLLTVIMASGYEHHQQTGDSDAQRQLQEGVRQMVREIAGLDLGEARLTSQGLSVP